MKKTGMSAVSESGDSHIVSSTKIDDSSLPEDIGNLVGDSFSDAPSDDSSSWMQKIDISNFRQLTWSETSSHPGLTVSDDHGGYTTASQTNPVLQSFPSPDSCHLSLTSPPLKKERTSFESVDSPRDYSAAEAAVQDPQEPQEPRSPEGQPVPGKTYSKPIYSYSCLIALALKNSKTGRLTVAEIYSFMCENFPYFNTAPAGWKNSVRHNLSLNKCFDKIEVETPGGHGRKSCLWTVNPQKAQKMDQEIRKWREKDPIGLRDSLACPNDLVLIENGLKGMPGAQNLYHTTSQRFLSHQLSEPVHKSNSLLLLQPVSNAFPFAPYNQPLQPPTIQSGLDIWGGGGVGPGVCAPRTPPRAHSSQDVLGHSPLPASYSTPLSGRRGLAPSQQQSSPFAHTPPYSPNVHSPQMKFGVVDWALSTEQPAFAQSFQSLHESPRMAVQSNSPYKTGLAARTPLGPYETAANALNNNSLLQSALAQSPCRQPPITLHSL